MIRRNLSALLLVTCLSIYAADITAKASATGRERAVAKCRQRIVTIVEDELCAMRYELWSPVLPGFPFELADKPSRLARAVADSVDIEVRNVLQSGHWEATGKLTEEMLRRMVKLDSDKRIFFLRNHIRTLQYYLNKSECDYRLVFNIIGNVLDICMLPDAPELADSVAHVVETTCGGLRIARQGDVVVPEGDLLVLRTRLYLDISPISVPTDAEACFIAPCADGQTVAATVRMGEEGWMTLRQQENGELPANRFFPGQWRVEMKPCRDADRMWHSEAILAYLDSISGGLSYTFNVMYLGRRRTYLRSDLPRVDEILSLFESEGHLFVNDQAEADWEVIVSTNLLDEGMNHGAFFTVIEAAIEVRHNGVQQYLEICDPYESFSSQSLAEARRKAYDQLEKLLAARLQQKLQQ